MCLVTNFNSIFLQVLLILESFFPNRFWVSLYLLNIAWATITHSLGKRKLNQLGYFQLYMGWSCCNEKKILKALILCWIICFNSFNHITHTFFLCLTLDAFLSCSEDWEAKIYMIWKDLASPSTSISVIDYCFSFMTSFLLYMCKCEYACACTWMCI